ncbi:MAG: hypothetical protein ABW185_17775 [Sedimenticola sp.]
MPLNIVYPSLLRMGDRQPAPEGAVGYFMEIPADVYRPHRDH